MSRMIRLANGLRLLRRLRRDADGVALIEMAFVAPFLMVLALGGIELISYSTAHMRVSQVAISLADNASRAKQEIVSGVPRMREVDVNEAFRAAELQAGALDIADNGLLILSSLETNADELIGVNDRADLARAEAAIQARLRARAMAAGATLTDPNSVFLSFDTKLGRDFTLGPNFVFGL